MEEKEEDAALMKTATSNQRYLYLSTWEASWKTSTHRYEAKIVCVVTSHLLVNHVFSE